MYDADVSVQQSVRASSQSRASGCGCGCDYYDDGIVQAMRESDDEGTNANRHAKEETRRDGESAMELMVENTKLWRRLA